MIFGGICRVANSSLSGVTSVLISHTLFSRLPEKEKATFEKYKDFYKKDYLGFSDQEGKYFLDLAEGFEGKNVSFEFLDLEDYGTLY
tara:strand:+ start:126 stop:386 length:261 start_codon:yes stop_codon:yes gene_type:complete